MRLGDHSMVGVSFALSFSAERTGCLDLSAQWLPYPQESQQHCDRDPLFTHLTRGLALGVRSRQLYLDRFAVRPRNKVLQCPIT